MEKKWQIFSRDIIFFKMSTILPILPIWHFLTIFGSFLKYGPLLRNRRRALAEFWICFLLYFFAKNGMLRKSNSHFGQ